MKLQYEDIVHILIVVVRVILRLFYMFSLLFVRVINVIIIVIVINICIVIVRVINDVYVFIVIVRVINIYFLEMPLQHDAFERRAFARAAVRNQLKRTRHSLEFRPEERVGLVSGRIHHWIKKVFHYFTISKAGHKFQREFNVELHGTDDDRELMARYNARREESGLAEFDRNVSRLREAIKKTLVNWSPE